MNVELTCFSSPVLRAAGAALLRIEAELRDFVAGEDVPASLIADIEQLGATGRWLAAATSINLTRGFPAAPASVPSITGAPTTGHTL